MSNIKYIVDQFVQSSLPKNEWTQQAHLTVAIWHLKNYSFDDAVCRLRSGIILLNKFHGTENNYKSGYHETLTIFWCKVISCYIEINPGKNIEELISGFLSSKLAARELPFNFYVKEEVLSSAFRAVYHEPTLQKLDMLAIKNS